MGAENWSLVETELCGDGVELGTELVWLAVEVLTLKLKPLLRLDGELSDSKTGVVRKDVAGIGRCVDGGPYTDARALLPELASADSLIPVKL